MQEMASWEGEGQGLLPFCLPASQLFLAGGIHQLWQRTSRCLASITSTVQALRSPESFQAYECSQVLLLLLPKLQYPLTFLIELSLVKLSMCLLSAAW
jgi:hypothetical protein